jgi:hypothetical protein
MEGASRQTLVEQVAADARERAVLPSPYLDRVRAATSRLAATERASDDLRSSLLAVEDHAGIDVDPPTASRWKAFVLVKLVVKRLTRWYFGYVAHRVTLFGYAIVRFGTATIERTEGLEEATKTLRERVDSLESRLGRLEQDVDGR